MQLLFRLRAGKRHYGVFKVLIMTKSSIALKPINTHDSPLCVLVFFTRSFHCDNHYPSGFQPFCANVCYFFSFWLTHVDSYTITEQFNYPKSSVFKSQEICVPLSIIWPGWSTLFYITVKQNKTNNKLIMHQCLQSMLAWGTWQY